MPPPYALLVRLYILGGIVYLRYIAPHDLVMLVACLARRIVRRHLCHLLVMSVTRQSVLVRFPVHFSCFLLFISTWFIRSDAL